MRLKTLVLMVMVSMCIVATAGSVVAQVNMDKLLKPAQLNETAPDKFQVKFDTSKGEILVEVTRSWAPIGADHFYNLIKNGYYDNCRFFRVVENFMVQFGVNGNPKINAVLGSAQIADDPVKQSNARGYITYAKTSAPNSRSTQLFINTRSGGNGFLDKDGFAPFGKVKKGMDVVDSIYKGYGDAPPNGTGPDQTRIKNEGNAYLEKSFPNLDYIKSATIVPGEQK